MQKNEKLAVEENITPQCFTQSYGEQDLAKISQMCCGGDDDPNQRVRIFNISQSIPHNPLALVVKTDIKNNLLLNQDWENFFKLFYPSEQTSTRRGGGKNKKETIKTAFNDISEDNPLKKALLATHKKDYIYKIIDACVDAQTGKEGSDNPLDRYIILGEDVNIQIHTFEVLIRDFATTINIFEQQKEADGNVPVFSLGLPTHHAYQDRASGFCIFNKVAMMIAYFKQQNIIVCGLDINADNGLQDCLMGLVRQGTAVPQVILHYDVYDSQVWPDTKYPDNKIKQADSEYYYKPIDMNEKTNNRKENAIHPVLQKLIHEISQQAKQHGSNLAIYIALGWDSHQEETASCARVILKNRDQEEQYRIEKRFNDEDFRWFYEQLLTLEKDFNIKFLYIGLEGGYTKDVYQRQSRSLVETACKVKKPNKNLVASGELEMPDKSEREEDNIEAESSGTKKRKSVAGGKKSPSKIEIKKHKNTSAYPPKLLDESKNIASGTLQLNLSSNDKQKKPLRRSPRKKT